MRRGAICPAAIVRLAGLPVAYADTAKSCEAGRRLVSLRSLQAAMHSLRPGLVHALHGLVPLLDADAAMRRLVLEAKRAVHGDRLPRMAAGGTAAVIRLLGLVDGAVFEAWLEAAMQVHGLAQETPDLEAEILRAARDGIARALADAPFMGSIQLYAPALAAQLEPWRSARTGKLDQAERTLLAYLHRAACKTSPLGAFTYIGFADIGAGDPSPRGAQDLYVASFANIGTLHAIARARAPAGLAADDRVRLASHTRIGADGRVRFLQSAYQAGNAGPWRTDVPSTITLPPSLASELAMLDTPTPMGVIAAKLERGGVSEAPALLSMLVERGILEVAGTMSRLEASLVPLASALRGLYRGAKGVARMQGRDRTRQLAVLADRVRPLLGVGDGEVASDPAQLVTEIGYVAPGGVALSSGELALIEELGRALRSYVTCDPLHARFWDLLAARRGSDRSVNAFEFAMDAQERRLVGGAGPDELRNRPLPRCLPAAAFLQFATQDDGTMLIVLNKVHPHGGSQAVRHLLQGDPTSSPFRHVYRKWLEDVHGDREPVELPVNAAFNPLQRHVPVTTRSFSWGREAGLRGRRLPLEKVALVARGEDRTFELRDVAGGKLALVYLGGAVPMPAWGLPYLLTLYANPIAFDFPRSSALADGSVLYMPRVSRGNVVLRRACWRVRGAALAPLLDGGVMQRMRKLAAFFDHHGIAWRTFIKAGGSPTAVGMAGRKPMLFDLENPLLHASLLKLVRGGADISFSEALPDPLMLKEAHVREVQVDLDLSRFDAG